MGCQKTLPVSPSDWSSGIIIYEHANYLGESAFVDKDTIESIKVARQ